MKHGWLRVLLLGGLFLGLSGPAAARETLVLDCEVLDCRAVLPGAVHFEAGEDGAPFKVGYGRDGAPLGWVVLSTDVVDIRAYSGQPMVTLVGLDTGGNIAGANIVKHSEPILLVGIPEKALDDFVDRYTGIPASSRVVVGRSASENVVRIDAISGATVTALAQNQTILDTARELGSAVGVLHFAEEARGAFVDDGEAWTWRDMERSRVFGRLTVSEADMELPGADGSFVDMWFSLADPPHIGRALLGDGDYRYMMSRLKPGEHLLVVLGKGSSSFKGSGFVRGGIFDRIRVEQGMRSLMFRDADYFNLPTVRAVGAPDFKEGAVFITRGKLDPGAPFDLVFVGSRYDGQGGFSRDFVEFQSTHQLPRSMYRSERGSGSFWIQAWSNQRYHVVALLAFLLFVGGLFVRRKWLTANMKRLQRVHVITLLIAFFGIGLVLRAQPSVTQLFTLLDGVRNEWRWGLFLSEPMLFISWIFIAIVIVVWGRGVFCGWVCPYGAMSELLHLLGRKLRLPNFELPERLHRVLRHGRYVVLAVLVGTFFYSAQLGELLAEIEPFKSTFFIAPWSREFIFFGWWLALAGISLFWFRPFCRYLCPLGAALALPSSFRLSGPRRRSFCDSCTICTRGCEPKAIRGNGTIDARECLSCMECEANYRDEKVCPPLVALERMQARAAERGLQPDAVKMHKLEKDKEDVVSGPLALAQWRPGTSETKGRDGGSS